uniref:Uncharacterized protein n=1 Tax=Lepeophtheirus salmonis TaxID=72036 RepID=A0A0K2TU13_LEPSM
MKHSSSLIYKCWTFLIDFQLENVELFTVEGIIERLTIGELLIIDYSLSITPNTQQHHPSCQSWLYSYYFERS